VITPPPAPTPLTLPDGYAEDYEAIRHGVAVVPAGRDILRVVGPDALEYLQGQCSQDVAALAVGASADALLLTPQGKLDALVRLTRVAEDDFTVDVDAGFGDVVATRLARFKLRVKAEISTLDWTCIAVRRPLQADRPGEIPDASDVAVAAPFGWAGIGGVDLFGVHPSLSEEIRLVSGEAWQSVRVESGIPVMGAELDERTIAAEAGLLERCVSFTKGCYTGQELVARLDSRGNKVARHLRGIVVDTEGDSPPGMAPGTEITVGEKVVGRVTSVAWSPALTAVVALAYVHRGVEPSSVVSLGAHADGGAALSGEVRTLPLID
jgi:folate-binding protein YgfZ